MGFCGVFSFDLFFLFLFGTGWLRILYQIAAFTNALHQMVTDVRILELQINSSLHRLFRVLLLLLKIRLSTPGRHQRHIRTIFSNIRWLRFVSVYMLQLIPLRRSEITAQILQILFSNNICDLFLGYSGLLTDGYLKFSSYFLLFG